MSTGLHEGLCPNGCGEFGYAGHRCRPKAPTPQSEADRLRKELWLAERAFDRLRHYDGWGPGERALLARLAREEQGRLTARLAELEAGDGDG